MVSIGDHPNLNPTVAELGAYAFRVDDEAAYPFLLERYPETVDQSGERMKDAIEDRHGGGRYHRHQGRRPAGDGGCSHAVAAGRTSRSDPRSPQITWGVAFDAESETATLRHELGPELDADRLWYDLVPVDAANRVENRSLWPGRDTVGPGDETTVDMSDHPDADGVDVRWGPKDHPYGLRLFSYVPDRGE